MPLKGDHSGDNAYWDVFQGTTEVGVPNVHIDCNPVTITNPVTGQALTTLSVIISSPQHDGIPCTNK